MRTVRLSLIACAVAALLVPAAASQEPPKPGPEHERLKRMEGVWEATMKMGDQESKGTMKYKMALGGLWLASEFEGEFGGMKFQGRGLSTYDAVKKKYIEVWADSMSTSPMLMEGTYDKAGKVLTSTGEGPGIDGPNTKYKSTLELKDNDTLVMTMATTGKDGKSNEMMTATFKRKK